MDQKARMERILALRQEVELIQRLNSEYHASRFHRRAAIRASEQRGKRLKEIMGELANLWEDEALGPAGAEVPAVRDEKGKSAVGPQKFIAAGHHQTSLPATMATYTEAVNEFTKNATAFMEQLPLLTKARDAYEQAMRASVELRKALDAGEENLRTFMTQLEQVVNVHVGQPAPDKKKPESMKVEAIRSKDESTGGVKTFP